MGTDRVRLGIFTIDDRQVIRTWDAWLVEATGIPAASALDRPVAEVVPELRSRGLLPLIENVIAHGTVEVLAPALHHYLIPCPPREPDSRFDRMQQHVTIGPLRDDGRVVGAVVTIQDVTSRIAHERELASRLATGRAARPAPAGVERLTELLGHDDWQVRRAAATGLAQQGPAIVEALVTTLREQHANFSVLSSVLDLLAMSDVDVIEPLAACLGDADPNLRIQAALILGERLDRRAIPFLVARLHDADVNVRFHVIEALGRLDAVEAAEALTAIAEQRDFFLAFPAIQALSRFGSTAMAPRLVPLLADEMLRAPVIEALGEIGDEDVTGPLVTLLNGSDAPAEVIADALAGLYERFESRYGAGEHIAALVRRSITATGAQRVLDAVNRVGSDRLPGLARVLGWLDGVAAQRALTRLLGHHHVRAQVVEALVRYGAGVVALLVEQLHAEDLETRQAAAVALGRIGDRRATAPLAAMLSNPELSVPVAGALARIGDSAAFEPLLALLGASDAAVRQAVIAALHSIGHPEMPRRVVRLLDDADPIVRESALRIAGYFGYRECLDRVLACCADRVEPVRRAAVEQLAFFDDERAFPELARALRTDTPAVRAAAASALSRVDHPDAVATVVSALADPDPWVRYFAVRALGSLGGDAAARAVIERLQRDQAPHVRLAAIDVIGRLRPPDALAILSDLVDAADEDVARAAIGALGRIERAEALALVERLLRDDARWRRLAAVDALALRSEPRVVESLQWVAAAAADAGIGDAAIAALARLGGHDDEQARAATAALVALTAEPARRPAAVAALATLSARRVPDIAAGLAHAAVDVRKAVVEALSRMKHPDASRALERALDDAAATVRLSAVVELKHLGARTSRRRLMTLARTDPDGDVRHAAVLAMARAGEASQPEPH